MELLNEPAAAIALLTVLGLLVGSFLNVCIHRLPLELSIVTPRSACPKCGRPITALENIPLISYLMLRGRCRGCGVHISLRYPMVEALNAALYVLIYVRTAMAWHTPNLWHLPAYLAFGSAMLVITFIDFDHQIIPDEITLPGAALGVIAGAFILPDPFNPSHLLGWKQTLIGAASGFGVFYAVAVLGSYAFKQDAMGGGDIKLMAMVGALVGWRGVLLTTFGGSLLGSIVGIAVMRCRGTGARTVMPFGPFLAIGALISLLYGRELMALWMPD